MLRHFFPMILCLLSASAFVCAEPLAIHVYLKSGERISGTTKSSIELPVEKAWFAASGMAYFVVEDLDLKKLRHKMDHGEDVPLRFSAKDVNWIVVDDEARSRQLYAEQLLLFRNEILINIDSEATQLQGRIVEDLIEALTALELPEAALRVEFDKGVDHEKRREVLESLHDEGRTRISVDSPSKNRRLMPLKDEARLMMYFKTKFSLESEYVVEVNGDTLSANAVPCSLEELGAVLARCGARSGRTVNLISSTDFSSELLKDVLIVLAEKGFRVKKLIATSPGS